MTAKLWLALLVLLSMRPASADTVRIFQSQASFLQAALEAPIVSTETFEEFAPGAHLANPAVVDGVSYQAINIQITEPGPPPVWEANSLTLDGTATSRSLIFTDLADHRLTFGQNGVVDAIGFYINNGAFLPVPMWDISVVSRDGTETACSLVGPLSPDSKAYVGFLSQSGISSITVADATVNGAVNWEYTEVSRSAIQAAPEPSTIWLALVGLLLSARLASLRCDPSKQRLAAGISG